MHSKVKARLCLRNGGTVVDVKGPITEWEADEVSAIFTVTIAQMDASGQIRTASGVSGAYSNPTPGVNWASPPNPKMWWTATANASDPALQLEFGPAIAYSTAIIQNSSNELEPYYWTILTRLIECDEHGDDDDDEESQQA